MVLQKMGRILVTFVMLAVGVSVSVPAWAQVAGATLSGTVKDASGAAIPDAQVSIKNVGTGISTVVITNADGFYTAPNLLPGAYAMTASARGFATEVHSGITLTVGEEQALDFSLKVGKVTQRIEVTGAAPTVQLASSSVGGLVGARTVVELPLNGRDWTSLAALQPGVSTVVNQPGASSASASRGNRGFGTQMAISGTRPEMNNYRLDGISIVDYAGGSPGSSMGLSLGVDAIAEFSVITGNSSAEYGRTGGGVINAITRSGTNQFHGDAYEFLRNSNLDARNFFDVNRAPFRRNQFGVSAGGPIQKNKTFFFANYEGLRQELGITSVDNTLSPDARNGLLNFASSSGFPTGCTALSATQCQLTVNPLVKPFLNLYPLPNAGLIGTGNTGHYIVGVNNIESDNFETARLDRNISEKDSIHGTQFYDAGESDNPDAFNDVLYGNTSTRDMISLEETHIFSPSLVNSLRGGYSRVDEHDSYPIKAINPLAADLSLGAFPGQPAPEIIATGLTTYVGEEGLALLYNTWNSFQAYDDAFLVKGDHSLKFGFAFERMQDNVSVFSKGSGAYSFGALSNFLTNQPVTFQGPVPGTLTPRGLRQSLFGGYLQDDWRWRPNVTLNLGLRYEMTTVPTEVQGKLVNLRTFTSPTPNLGSPLFENPTLRNFEPRIGFAWDPFHSGKTAVRGAFGIFDALPLTYEYFQPLTQSAPFAEVLAGRNLPIGSFPTGAASTTNINPAKLSSDSIQYNAPRNYVMIWNLNVQRQLTPSTTLTVGYVGNHGVHNLDGGDDINMVIPTATSEGYLWPSSRGSGTVLNPNIGEIRGRYWGGDSEYDALEVGVTKRMTHGFQVQGSYTWSKNIDTGSASNTGGQFLNSISTLLWFGCKTCRRSLSDYNVAQTLAVNYIWDIPTPKNLGAIGSHVLGGWELGGILTGETGIPMTTLVGGDPLGLNSTDPYAYPNRLTGPGCTSDVNPGNPNNYIKLNCFAPANPLTLLGNAGRNTVIGPGLVEFDASLVKNNYIKRISENFNVQFRAEFFNILNRANFAAPTDNETLFSQTGSPVGGAGSIDGTSAAQREIQFALKLIW